jgi:two-component system LytT family response regulator
MIEQYRDIMALVQKNTHSDILLHAASGGELDPHVIKKPLNQWEVRLPEELFLKVNRSLLVNAELITRIVKLTRDEYEISLRGLSRPIPVGRLAMQRIREKLPTV